MLHIIVNYKTNTLQLEAARRHTSPFPL